MKRRHAQYTVRGVPKRVDQVLREKALREHRSINETVLDTLRHGLHLDEEEVVHHDLDDLVGTWLNDAEFDKAVEAMDRIDSELWT